MTHAASSRLAPARSAVGPPSRGCANRCLKDLPLCARLGFRLLIKIPKLRESDPTIPSTTKLSTAFTIYHTSCCSAPTTLEEVPTADRGFSCINGQTELPIGQNLRIAQSHPHHYHSANRQRKTRYGFDRTSRTSSRRRRRRTRQRTLWT